MPGNGIGVELSVVVIWTGELVSGPDPLPARIDVPKKNPAAAAIAPAVPIAKAILRVPVIPGFTG